MIIHNPLNFIHHFELRKKCNIELNKGNLVTTIRINELVFDIIVSKSLIELDLQFDINNCIIDSLFESWNSTLC